jgi:prepilin-type N-terminal cleavage/methylation domain-containing protein
MKNINKGFTLAELMVVIGLIAILMTFTLISINKNKVQTRDNLRVSDIQTIRLALEQYRASCGVFPATLELDTNNTRSNPSGCQFELGDFIAEIPKAPKRSNVSQVLIKRVAQKDNDYSGYFYAGLSSRSDGPCFDYHIAAELEYAADNGETPSKYLELDHDFVAGDEPFNFACINSPNDFGIGGDDDDIIGLYNFRSQKAGESN